MDMGTDGMDVGMDSMALLEEFCHLLHSDHGENDL